MYIFSKVAACLHLTTTYKQRQFCDQHDKWNKKTNGRNINPRIVNGLLVYTWLPLVDMQYSPYSVFTCVPASALYVVTEWLNIKTRNLDQTQS